MSVRSGQSITADFVTSRFDTGAATAADSLPTGTLVVNGTDDAASVTVTSKTGGKYKAAVTLPTLAVGDVVQLRIAATVNSVSGVGIIWTDTKDIVIDSDGLADANAVKVGPTGSGTAQTAGDILARLPTALSGGNMKADILAVNTSAAAAALLASMHSSLETGTAQGGGTLSITLRSGASSVNDAFKNQAVWILSGTGAGQTNFGTTYNGTTKVLTVQTAWVVQPDNTSVYVVLGRVTS